MKKTSLWIVSWGILFLFLLQAAGTLVESIYILDLLNTSLDEKALGLLFFFSPAVLWLFRKKTPSWFLWGMLALLLVSRSLVPFLPTAGRLLAAGIGTGTALMLLAWLLSGEAGDSRQEETAAAGLALATGLSVLLRTANGSIDYSLTMGGAWAGWLLAVALGVGLYQGISSPGETQSARPRSLAVFGVFLAWGLIYFAFSAPSVIARWVEGDYFWIVAAVSLLSLGYVLVAVNWSGLLDRVNPGFLLIWNLLFTLGLTQTFLAHRVSLPGSPAADPVVVGAPTWLQQLPLAAALLLFPVLFLDVRYFLQIKGNKKAAASGLVGAFLLSMFALILLIFMHIFTNVWGYVEPVSPLFRNKFGLLFTLMAGLLTLGVAWTLRKPASPAAAKAPLFSWTWTAGLGLVFAVTVFFAWNSERITATPGQADTIVVMTYNIQQANDHNAEKSYTRQLALIREISPDILALQESDSARVSLNNNDYVRYFASELGYYSYYGPKTTTGTFGTAILSRYPLENPRSVFTFSDQDEVGTAEAEIVVNGQRITIYNVHPDGSDAAMESFARALLARSAGKERVIALGDYNLRSNEVAFQMVAAVYTNAWTALYPSAISDTGLDMSGRNRIDHIFVSAGFEVESAEYRLPPESHTDHPVHWAVLRVLP